MHSPETVRSVCCTIAGNMRRIRLAKRWTQFDAAAGCWGSLPPGGVY